MSGPTSEYKSANVKKVVWVKFQEESFIFYDCWDSGLLFKTKKDVD